MSDKIAFIADIHLGLSNRLDDIMWALKSVRDYCFNNNIETVIVLGDLFHDRSVLAIDTLCTAHDFFKYAKEYNNQEWIVFPGNHDMFLKHGWGITSLKPYSEILTIVDDVKIIKFNDRRFWVLPFIYSESVYMEVLSNIEKQHAEGDVLLTHVGVCGAALNSCFLLQNWSIVQFASSKFKQVFAGHYHVHQQVGENLWYPGSILPYKFDEGDIDHGFIVYDTISGEHEFIDILSIAPNDQAMHEDIKPPRYCTIRGGLNDNIDVSNSMVRIVAEKQYSHNEKQEIKESLISAGARNVVFIEGKDNKEQAKIKDDAESIPIHELFVKWVDIDDKGTKKLDKKLLMHLNASIVIDGDNIYSQSR